MKLSRQLGYKTLAPAHKKLVLEKKIVLPANHRFLSWDVFKNKGLPIDSKWFNIIGNSWWNAEMDDEWTNFGVVVSAPANAKNDRTAELLAENKELKKKLATLGRLINEL